MWFQSQPALLTPEGQQLGPPVWASCVPAVPPPIGAWGAELSLLSASKWTLEREGPLEITQVINGPIGLKRKPKPEGVSDVPTVTLQGSGRAQPGTQDPRSWVSGPYPQRHCGGREASYCGKWDSAPQEEHSQASVRQDIASAPAHHMFRVALGGILRF